MLMQTGEVRTSALSIKGLGGWGYSVELLPLSRVTFPTREEAVEALYHLAEDVVAEAIKRGITQAEHRNEAIYGVRTWLFPSINIDDFLVRAQRSAGNYPEGTERNGKWMIFPPTSDVDEHWARILRALDAGVLGDSAKVATARENPNAIRASEKLICVYTYDADDYADVSRVRQALRAIGYTRKLPYKMDSATLAGQYSRDGGRVSRYCE
jgi:hypothetical protein